MQYFWIFAGDSQSSFVILLKTLTEKKDKVFKKAIQSYRYRDSERDRERDSCKGKAGGNTKGAQQL